MSIFQVARRFLLMRRLAAAALLGVLLSLSTVTSAGAKHDFLCELFSTHPCPQHPTLPSHPPKSTPPPPPIVTPTPTAAVAPVPPAPPPLPSASPPVSVLPDAAMDRP